MQKYNKLWIALAGAIITVLVDYFGNHELVAQLIPFLTALGVYRTPNL